MHERPTTVIKDSFGAAERRLKELYDRQQRHVKQSAVSESVRIVAMRFRDDGDGFITDPSEQEVYFHMNAVLDGFDRLRIGTAVRHNAELGDNGLRATAARREEKPDRRREREDTEPGPIE